jgi:NadR type nicotinamide-nucleotide adenylyltransferase
MKRVVFTGPESTGKSTLAMQLSEMFNYQWVSEYARAYLNYLGRPYVQDDLLQIAKRQVISESLAFKKSDKLICDTDLLTLKVWSDYKYGNCNPWILNQLQTNLPDLYLLCYPDLEWEYDPLRENPEDRHELFEIYLSEIEKLGVPFQIIKGKDEKRIDNAVNAVRKIIF